MGGGLREHQVRPILIFFSHSPAQADEKAQNGAR